MSEKVKLNLHCHSNQSDGLLSPAELASRLADAGAVVAALTDHDTVAGSALFREALSLRGVAYVDAVELTTFCERGELHLLAYGIETNSPELLTTLAAITGSVDEDLRGFVEYVRHLGKRPHAGRLETEAAIAMIHRCGGIAVLAHPLDIPGSPNDLESLLNGLTAVGLDGLEAHYGPYGETDRNRLLNLAESRGLCVSAGSDFHLLGDTVHQMVIEVEENVWRGFRDRLLRRRPIPTNAAAVQHRSDVSGLDRNTAPSLFRVKPEKFKLGVYSARIMAASILALGLFVASLFAVSIPFFEYVLIDRKKEMIRELTIEAVSLIAEYAALETEGRMTRAEAQADAIAHIRDLRYGRDGKDYFWVTDTTPRMLMHPYRTDLEGQDVSDYRDDNGLRVFYEFARAVRDDHEGYVEYLWQWKDDKDRIVPKLSFVMRFDVWNWIVGTGVYIDDVAIEIHSLTGRLIWLSILIALILTFLLAYIARQSFRIEREKRVSEFAVRESRERYRALVEATDEGMVIVIDGACTFANVSFLEMSGYAEAEIVLLGFSELVMSYEGEEEAAVAFLASLPKNSQNLGEIGWEASPSAQTDASFACLLKRRSNDPIDVVLQTSAFSLGGKRGAVISVRSTGAYGSLEIPTDLGDRDVAAIAGIGAFQARLNRRASIIKADPVAIWLLGMEDSGDHASIADRFMDEREWEAVYSELLASGRLANRSIHLRSRTLVGRNVVAKTVLLSAKATKGPQPGDRNFSAIISEPVDLLSEIITLREAAVDRHIGDDLAAFIIEVATAPSLDELHQIRQKAIIHTRRAVGFRSSVVSHMLSKLNDAVIRRLSVFAEIVLGPPPAPYTFLILGSGGREEILPSSDQDNAIVFLPSNAEEKNHDIAENARSRCIGQSAETDNVQRYFLGLGANICEALNQLGTPECPGGVMAKNPVWCAPLDQWRLKFASWIAAPDPEEMLALNLSFDFRALSGDDSIAAALRLSVNESLSNHPAFLVHLARESLRFRATFPLSGALFPGVSSDLDINIKELASQFVLIARLYALRDGISETNTDRRFTALVGCGSFTPSFADDLQTTYAALNDLRLARLEFGFKIPIKAIRPMEEAILRTAFTQIALAQKKISYDFPGAAI